MKTEVTVMALPALEEWRERYRREMNCQIVHDSWHRRGFTDLYGFRVGGRLVGYGAVGGSPGEPKDIVKEFYLDRDARGAAVELFEALIEVTRARSIEAQTNDNLLSLMLFDSKREPSSSPMPSSRRSTRRVQWCGA